MLVLLPDPTFRGIFFVGYAVRTIHLPRAPCIEADISV